MADFVVVKFIQLFKIGDAASLFKLLVAYNHVFAFLELPDL